MDNPYALDYQIINTIDENLDYYFQQKLDNIKTGATNIKSKVMMLF